jgi:hypothetical protein
MLRVTRYSPCQNGIWALVAIFALVGGLATSAKAASRAAARPGPAAANPFIQGLLVSEWQPLAAPSSGVAASRTQTQTQTQTRLVPVPAVKSTAAALTQSGHGSDGAGYFLSAANNRRYPNPWIQLVSGRGVAEWRTDEIALGRVGHGAATDAVRLSVRALKRAPLGLVLNPDFDSMGTDTEAYDVTYLRGWPSALTIRAGAYDLDISPHAGLGITNEGGSAEAGATVRLGSSYADARARRVAESLGLSTVEGSSFGDQARLYLYAAASGRALGLNVVRDRETGGLRGSGWSIDPAAVLISDAQAGIGWRQGSVQASLGYLHRDIRNEFGVRGMKLDGDSIVALSFAIRPSQ